MADKHFYGWKKQKEDPRDFKLVLPHNAFKANPVSVDLRSVMPTVYDQGDLGSCTANALAGLLEYQELKEKHLDVLPSRLFIYYNSRALEGSIHEDSGAEIRDAIKSVVQWGFCDDVLWPYDITQFTKTPSHVAYGKAYHEKIKQYALVNQDANDMQTVLAAGHPIDFGFYVYESFESDAVANTGIMPMPAPGEQILGGHSVLIVGYDQNTQYYICRNSWGTSWGQAGYFTMPFAFAHSPSYCSDFWTINYVP